MMEVLYTFSAENARMFRAIEMLDSLVMFLAEVRLNFLVLAQI